MNHKVLFVDDDIHVLQAFKRQLRKQFHIDTAQSPAEGLSIVEKNGPYAVVVSDLRMPGMDGNQFMTRLKKIAPETVRIMLTGHADLNVAMGAINTGNIFRLLTKPCPSDVISESIKSGIERYLENTIKEKTVVKTTVPHVRNLLVVDDDPDTCDLIRNGLSSYREFQVLSADSGQAAVEHLNSQEVSFVITELKLPVMNGLKLLSHMRKFYPEIPVIVLTGYGTAEIEAQIIKLDTITYFEKPLDIGVLVDMISTALQDRVPGQISGISTAAFLQLMFNEQKTCTLSIQSEGRTGKLYLQKGELIDAETENRKALNAATYIIAWDKPVINIESSCRKFEKKIQQSMMSILLDSARKKDDMKNEAMIRTQQLASDRFKTEKGREKWLE
jgi:FixJ family two-component response regulator